MKGPFSEDRFVYQPVSDTYSCPVGQPLRRRRYIRRQRVWAYGAAAKRDRQRRQYLVEDSFAQATNNHGFKQARWRRLWWQQIQDHLIAAIQNIRILLAQTVLKPAASAAGAVGKALGLKWTGGSALLGDPKALSPAE